MIKKKKALDKDIFKVYQNLFMSDNFPWFYGKYQTEEGKDSGYMYHALYRNNFVNSNYYKDMFPLFDVLRPKAIINVRANLSLNYKSKNYSEWHTDHYFIKNPSHKTAIFYLNTNNGYTEFKDGEKVISEENKLIIFDCNKEHRAVSQTDKDFRIVLNINYYE
tara:strand:+ start:2517 stop:3005 length:489 start_codon:yes stop_codon:yes gene_type:complete